MPRHVEDDEYELEDELPPQRNIDRRSARHRWTSPGRPTQSPRVAVPRTADVDASRAQRRRASSSLPARSISAIIGSMLFVIAIVGFVWFATYKHPLSTLPPLPILGPTKSPTEQVPPLLAAGINLAHPTQTPALNQQQALLIASQLEPEAAANAQNTTAQYVLLNYTNRNASITRPNLSGVPAWMILYQGIPLQPSDPSVDPTPYPQTQHNLYVFLDATTGKELLAIWV